jgi:hypothetical protein
MTHVITSGMKNNKQVCGRSSETSSHPIDMNIHPHLFTQYPSNHTYIGYIHSFIHYLVCSSIHRSICMLSQSPQPTGVAYCNLLQMSCPSNSHFLHGRLSPRGSTSWLLVGNSTQNLNQAKSQLWTVLRYANEFLTTLRHTLVLSVYFTCTYAVHNSTDSTLHRDADYISTKQIKLRVLLACHTRVSWHRSHQVTTICKVVSTETVINSGALHVVRR